MRGNRTLRYFLDYIQKLPQLSHKEKYILSRRLKKHTLEKIGENFDVTEGRVRQVERAILRKVKSKTYQQALFSKYKSSK